MSAEVILAETPARVRTTVVDIGVCALKAMKESTVNGVRSLRKRYDFLAAVCVKVKVRSNNL